MKKYIFFFAAAALSLAACSKNEVTPAFVDGNAEITFNVAPKTKALAAGQEDFNHANVFTSYAYYLAPGKNWADDFASAKLYIDNSVISYVTDKWKNATATYYWPKDGGSLTFFAYSLNKGDMTFDGGDSVMGCKVEAEADGSLSGGINGAIDVLPNKNVDFLVADIQADKTANENVYTHTGVPTLFRHKLSMVNVTAKLKEDYADKKFTVNDVKFTQISHFGAYCQFPEKMTESGTKVDQIYAENAGLVVTTTKATVPYVINDADGAKTDDGQYIYIPQTFEDSDDVVIEIKYTIETTVGTSPVKEECVSKTKISDVFPKWEIGKKYVLDLTFSLDEILWDPAVQEWETGTTGNITIE